MTGYDYKLNILSTMQTKMLIFKSLFLILNSQPFITRYCHVADISHFHSSHIILVIDNIQAV